MGIPCNPAKLISLLATRRTSRKRRFSYQTSSIDQFWSHSWHGSKYSKILTALYLNNGMLAVLVSTLGSLMVMIFVGLGLIPGLRTSGGLPLTPWCLLSGFGMYLLVLFGWRPRHSIFIDVLCINQQDEVEKAAGLLSMGAILKCSDALLVLWDATYTRRLWCVFEMSAFLHSRPANQRPKLTIRPTILGPCLISLPIALVAIVVAIGLLDWDELAHKKHILFPLMALCAFIGGYVVVAVLRAYFGSVQQLQDELCNFTVRDSLCFCCSTNHVSKRGHPIACDRRIVLQCIRTWFGSVEAFDAKVRTQVLELLAQQLSNEIWTYTQCAGSAIPLLWHFMDNAATNAAMVPDHNGTLYILWAIRELVRGLGWTLGVLPLVFFLGARLAYAFRRRRTWLCCGVLVNSSIVGFLVLAPGLLLKNLGFIFHAGYI